MEISVVILNYLNWKDTIECVDSLLSQSYKKLQIVLVDNHSNNESIDVFEKRYQQSHNVHILETTCNEGFARGNNVGITYSLDELNIKNIFVANNDTIFDDKEYFTKLSQYSFESTVGVIGTQIIGSDGLNQNPYNVRVDGLYLLKRIFFLSKDLILERIKISKKTKTGPIADTNTNNINSKNIRRKNKTKAIFHGSAIFLTENYLSMSRGFYPKTFLYNEERILFYMLKKMRLSMIYIDDLSLYHKEDQSSALSFGNKSNIMKKYSRKSTLHGLLVKYLPIILILKITNEYKYSYKKL